MAVRSGDISRKPRADSVRNRERLLKAAARILGTGGGDASLEAVARRAGVGIGTLYRHFPARQALLEAVYKDQVDGLDALAAKLLTAESPGEALGDWIRAFVAFGRTKRNLSSALVASIGKDSELMSACGMILRTRTDELLSRAQEAGEARGDVKCADIFRLAHGLIMATEATPSDPEQPERLLALVVGSVVPGIAR